MLFAAVALAGCATRPEQISAAYVSPQIYASLDCEQLKSEYRNVKWRLDAATESQNARADQDALMTGVGVLLIWPALFAVGSHGDGSANVAELKGHKAALETAMDSKSCSATAKPSEPAAS